MSQRVLIGIKSDGDSETLRKELLSLGADTVSEPSAVQPDLIVATVPSGKYADTFVTEARKLRGVRYAELDSWRFSM